jgi:hypothetical protein
VRFDWETVIDPQQGVSVLSWGSLRDGIKTHYELMVPVRHLIHVLRQPLCPLLRCSMQHGDIAMSHTGRESFQEEPMMSPPMEFIDLGSNMTALIHAVVQTNLRSDLRRKIEGQASARHARLGRRSPPATARQLAPRPAGRSSAHGYDSGAKAWLTGVTACAKVELGNPH